MKRFNLKVFVALVLAVAACSTGQKKTAVREKLSSSEYYERAMKYADSYQNSSFNSEDDYARAEHYFREAADLDTQNPDLWFNLGRLYLYHRNYDEANACLRKAVRYRREFTEAYSLLIKTYLRKGNLDYALTIAKKSNAILPGNNVLLNDLANIYARMSMFDRARDICMGIIRKNAKFTSAYVTLGNIYYLEKKLELARLIYLKAIEAGDQSGEVYTNLGIIALALGDKNEAHDLLKKAKNNSPSDSYTCLNLGKYYLDAGDFEGAMNEFKTALRLNPRLVEGWNNLAIVFVKLKLFEKAAKAYEQAMLYDPSYAEVYFNYGILLADYISDYSRAEAMYNRFILLKGDQIDNTHRVYIYLRDLQAKISKKEKTG
ncbi:MAG: tetratricopeptide repeat protein [Oligoflexia bacterium]|nr:tetratricopeptide repeat protein [Oligoflexia bacterium]